MLGLNLSYIIPSTIAGFLFYYVYATYDRRNRLANSIIVLLGAIIDWYPVFFGGMVSKVTIIGAIHGLITLLAYMILFVWLVTYNKKVYGCFWWVWVIAYVLGYLS